MKVLVVEDDATTRFLVTSLLKNRGYEVCESSNGKEAWKSLRREHVPLVLCDWLMPEMSGPELCRKVRSRKGVPYTYFILLTVLDNRRCYLEGMESGADDYVTKPFDFDKLHARLCVAERILSNPCCGKRLDGLIPVCSYCREVRDEEDRWCSLESFIQKHAPVSFTHSICPTCYQTHVQPEIQALRATRHSPVNNLGTRGDEGEERK